MRKGNKLKKIFTLLLAAVMMFTMGISAFAEPRIGHSITINGDNVSGKTFRAYKLLNATVTEDKTGASYAVNSEAKSLLEAVTGKSNESDIMEAIRTASEDESKLRTLADDFAKNLAASSITATKEAIGTDTGVVFEGLDNGYYLIVDTDNKSVSTAAILIAVSGDNASVDLKGSTPTVVKKVKENESYKMDGGFGYGYNDVADYNIGDEVPFKFYSVVPDMTGYETYKYIFHDTMSKGLTLNEDSIKVSVTDKEIGKDKYKFIKTKDGFSIEIADLKPLCKGFFNTVSVEFTATLNENAVIGGEGNPNVVKLEYSSNPYDESVTTTTPLDKVVVYTFELNVDKIKAGTAGESAVKLEGAQFKLYSDEECTKEIKFKKINDITNEYVVDPAGIDVLTSTKDSVIKVKGLDSGTYYLKETKAPQGYVLPTKSWKIDIKADYPIDRQEWEGTTNALLNYNGTVDDKTDLNSDKNTGVISVTIENSTTGILPGTGGIGTTIFYIVGGILMAGAVVLLVVNNKKKTA